MPQTSAVPKEDYYFPEPGDIEPTGIPAGAMASSPDHVSDLRAAYRMAFAEDVAGHPDPVLAQFTLRLADRLGWTAR